MRAALVYNPGKRSDCPQAVLLDKRSHACHKRQTNAASDWFVTYAGHKRAKPFRRYQEASSLTEYDLMIPHLLTMHIHSRTLEESPVQNLGRNEGGVHAWYVQGCGAYKRFQEKCARSSLRAQMRDLTILLALSQQVASNGMV
jgi:hypothetical protein